MDVEINHPEYGWVPYTINKSVLNPSVDREALLELIGTDFAPFSQADHDARTATFVRDTRDLKLAQEVDPVVSNPLRWGDLSEQEQADVSAYRLALLDVPSQSGFPNTVSWPTKPSCL
jgi:hypothetical protein